MPRHVDITIFRRKKKKCIVIVTLNTVVESES